MSTPVTTYDKRPVIVSPTAPTSLEQLRYLWLDISETTPVLRYYNNGIWEVINDVDTSSFLTTNGVQTITGAKTFNTGTITVADITVADVTIEGIDTIKLTDDDTHVPTSKLVEDTLVSAISGLETSIDGKLATKANSADVVLKTDISTSIPSAGAVDTKVASEKAVADSLAAKQNSLKYYSEGTNTVTIETAEQANNNISIKAGIAGLEMGRDSSDTSTAVKLGVFHEDTVTQGLTVTTEHVDITSPGGFHINNSTPNVTTIVDSINLQSGGENALPTASAVRVAVNQIKTDLGSALTYKGSVDTYDQLPDDAEVGDTWNVAQAYQTYPAGTNYAWTGTAWDALGGSVDLSGYQTKSDDTLATSAKTVVGAINEVNTALSDKQDKLLYYSETSGGTPSATISAANIKFTGRVAEGGGTTASGQYSHAEGVVTTASGDYSHAEGSNTTASGSSSHAEGTSTTASGIASHAEGTSTIASSDYQHAQGKFNIEDVNDKYADIIGNGTSDSARSNAATVSWDGISWSQTDVRAGGTDQDAATHSLAAKQNATDNSLTTTDKTIVGAINELSVDKQNTLKYYSESDSSTESFSNNAQVSILKNSDYGGTLNLGFESSNGIQTINIGGSSNTRNINIGTKICGENNNVTIGNASDGVLLTLNTGRGLAGTGVTKDLSTSATDAQLPTAAAVKAVTDAKQNSTDNSLITAAKTVVGAINEIENKVLDSRLSKLSAGALYFNSGKLSGSNFAIPNFPFSICATVRIDAWRGASEHSQPIFQYGELGSGTGSTFSMSFANGDDNPVLQLIITDKIDGANKSTLVNCALDLSTFLGKVHTIIGICRAVTAEALNWDIYIDGAKQNIAASAKNAIVSSLSGTRNWAVNTSNYNFSSQPASANPMMLRNLYIFNFDVSAEGSPYSIADYEAGRLIPPALKPSQVSLALENYTIARNATTTLVKDASGNSNDATVKVSSGGYVAGDNDQSIKVFVDEIKTQINQANG